MNPQTNKEEQTVIDWESSPKETPKKQFSNCIYTYYVGHYTSVMCRDCVYGPNGTSNCKLNWTNSSAAGCAHHGVVLPEILEEVKRYYDSMEEEDEQA